MLREFDKIKPIIKQTIALLSLDKKPLVDQFSIFYLLNIEIEGEEATVIENAY